MESNERTVSEYDFEIVFNVSNELCQQLSEIHSLAFTKSWSANQFESIFQSENCFLIISREINENEELNKTHQNIDGFIVIQNCLKISDIITIAVTKSKQGRGIGKSLLQTSINALRLMMVKEIFLEVSDRNVKALKLYKHFDFAKISIRKGYYSDGSNAILMKKNI